MKKRLEKILERDKYVCGAHFGGCEKRINPEQDKPTLDHIFSRSYLKNHKNKDKFRKSWNYQAMCGECNDKKGGQLINTPIFKCKCHYIYIKPNGDRHIFYKVKKKWEDFCYVNIVNSDRSTLTMIPGKKGNAVGFSVIGNNKFGHIMYSYGIFGSVLFNANQLFRVGQFKKVIDEYFIFKKTYLQDKGFLFEQEQGNNKIKFLSEFYFLKIVSSLYVKYGVKDGMLVLSEYFLNRRHSIGHNLESEILELDKNNINIIFKYIITLTENHLDHLINSGYLKILRHTISPN